MNKFFSLLDFQKRWSVSIGPLLTLIALSFFIFYYAKITVQMISIFSVKAIIDGLMLLATTASQGELLVIGMMILFVSFSPRKITLAICVLEVYLFLFVSNAKLLNNHSDMVLARDIALLFYYSFISIVVCVGIIRLMFLLYERNAKVVWHSLDTALAIMAIVIFGHLFNYVVRLPFYPQTIDSTNYWYLILPWLITFYLWKLNFVGYFDKPLESDSNNKYYYGIK